MRKLRFSERRIALACAMLLVALSGFAALRNHSFSLPFLHQSETSPVSQTAQPPAQPVKSSPQQPLETTGSPKSVATYDYTAVAGDSYTGFAREAIISYANQNHLSLSKSQSLDAEVSLTNQAGAPLLEIGQRVMIARSDVKSAIESTGVVGQTLPSAASVSHESTAPQPTASRTDFSKTAQPGDSYTTLVRGIVADYLKQQHLSLDSPQLAYTESFIVSAAGYPQLEVSQTISLSRVILQQATSKAAALSPSDEAPWRLYADRIAW